MISVEKTKQLPDKNSAGRGRKLCNGCNTYIGVRTKICSCGFDFSKNESEKEQTEVKEKPAREIKVSLEPSKGRKQCHGCKKYIGVRTAICSCGFDFTIHVVSGLEPDEDTSSVSLPPEDGDTKTKEKKEKVIQSYKEKVVFREKDLTGRRTLIIAGSGRPKYNLENLEEDTVKQWVEKMYSFGLEKNEVFSCEALYYYASQKFPAHTYVDLFEIIKKAYL